MFYLLLSESEKQRARNLEIRNCEVHDLTLSEIYLLPTVFGRKSLLLSFSELDRRIRRGKDVVEPKPQNFDPHYFGNND